MILKSHVKSLGFLDKVDVEAAARQETILHRASWSFALEHGGPVLHNFIKKIGAGPGWIFDVRVHHLLKDQLPAIDAYHLDFWTDTNPQAKVVIGVIGDCSLTRFIDLDIEVLTKHFEYFSRQIPSRIKYGEDEPDTYQIKNYEIIEYNSSTFHKATPAIKKGWRILVRAAKGSDALVPNNEKDFPSLIWNKGNKGNPDWWVHDGKLRRHPHANTQSFLEDVDPNYDLET
jgi:hypothetical protein